MKHYTTIKNKTKKINFLNIRKNLKNNIINDFKLNNKKNYNLKLKEIL